MAKGRYDCILEKIIIILLVQNIPSFKKLPLTTSALNMFNHSVLWFICIFRNKNPQMGDIENLAAVSRYIVIIKHTKSVSFMCLIHRM